MNLDDVRRIVLGRLSTAEAHLQAEQLEVNRSTGKDFDWHCAERDKYSARVRELEALCWDLGYAPGIFDEVDVEAARLLRSIRKNQQLIQDQRH